MASNMSFTDALINRLTTYYYAVQGLLYFCSYLPKTFLLHPLTLFTSPSTFQRLWFFRAWDAVGPLMAANPDQVATIANLVGPNTHGVVLEVGPGNGDHTHHYTALLQSGAISKVYAVEPNKFLHEKLRENARKAGFSDDQYIILAAGGQPASLVPALQAEGLFTADGKIPPEGIFDTVISIKTFCSFSKPVLEETFTILQAMLKPGGKAIFFEHLGNKDDKITHIFVWFIMWVWPIAHGGCRLDCQLDDVLAAMPGWSKKQWSEDNGVVPWSVLRYVRGWVQKA